MPEETQGGAVVGLAELLGLLAMPRLSAPARLLANAKVIGPNAHGINGALYELELQRIELIKFNLFDNNKTYEAYVTGRKRRGRAGTEYLAGNAISAEPSRLRCRWRPAAGLSRRVDPLPYSRPVHATTSATR